MIGILYSTLPLKVSNVSELKLQRAQGCLAAIQNSLYCKVLGFARIAETKDIFQVDDEVIFFESEVEVPQFPTNDIRQTETIALIFQKEDLSTPFVFALREDFPTVVHQHLFYKDYPKSLCIYEKSFDELKITWSAAGFIEDIRNWLKYTAKGKLHQEDQRLEPFVLFYEGDIVLPYDLKQEETLFSQVHLNSDKVNIITQRTPFHSKSQVCFKVVFLNGVPQIHGQIQFTPRNCNELADFLSTAKIDFTEELLKALKVNKENTLHRLLFVICLPKKRNESSGELEFEHHVYCTFKDIQGIGTDIGLWEERGNLLIDILNFDNKPYDFTKVNIGLLKPQRSYNRHFANMLNNNLAVRDIPKIIAIGLGSLGSQVFMNLARSGWGKWVLVDDDILFPHNLARHSLTDEYIMLPKVDSLSFIANAMLSDSDFSIPIVANIVRPATNEQKKFLDEKILSSDYVFDFSASISVPRYLCNGATFASKRIFSSFLSPTGEYSVLLYEDYMKDITIDVLEMFFYREVLNNESMSSYFEYFEKDDIRYSTSCRDKSSRIPIENINVHASNASHFIKRSLNDVNPYALCFQYKELNLVKYQIPISKVHRQKVSGWEIILDEYFLEKIGQLRHHKLPKETGGILIGSWDVEYNRIYILDIIIADDNIEYPTCFYRGVEGIKENLNWVNKKTAGTLKYVGEWHSHPKGCSTNASPDDMKLLEWLSYNMSVESLPALMLILGDDNKFNIYLGNTA